MNHGRLLLRSLGLLAAAAVIPSCGGGGGDGGGGTPSTFVVNFRSPSDLATGICRTPIVTVSFNRAPDPLTIDPTTFTLTEGMTPVTAGVNYDATCDVATLDAAAPLAASTVYTVTLTGDIQDATGEMLATDTFTFTTGAFADFTRPSFSGLANATATGISTVSLDWIAATDDVAVDSYDIFVSTVSNCFDFTAPSQTALSSPATVGGLTPNTTCYFVVRARDASGNVDQNTIQRSATTGVSFSQTLWPIVQSECRTCHTTGSGAAQTNMDYADAGTTYGSWVSQPEQCGAPGYSLRVDPGSPSTSFLYEKIDPLGLGDGSGTPECGVRMPFGGGPLSAARIQAFRDWIAQGAANN